MASQRQKRAQEVLTKLDVWRFQRGLSFGELDALLDVNPGTCSRWLGRGKGSCLPKAENVGLIEQFLAKEKGGEDRVKSHNGTSGPWQGIEGALRGLIRAEIKTVVRDEVRRALRELTEVEGD